MGLDLRLPIGMMFGLIGLLLVGIGLCTGPEKKSLDMNINLWWGLVLIVFSAYMLLTARHAANKAKAAAAKKE